MVWPTARLAKEAELLWDETCRACDWLADNGCHDAPVRPAKTRDTDESLRQYQAVRQYLHAKTNRKPGRAVPLTPEDEAILRALAQDHPTTMSQETLAELTKVSVKTVGKRLAYLTECKLVHRPRGPHGGSGLTPAGLKMVGR